MGKRLCSAAVVVMLVAALLCTAEAQEVHVVGDNLGWLVPPGGPIAYATWAALQAFTVGDILVFDFTTGEQDVARVTKEAFDACNSTKPIWLETKGPANFTLSSAGEFYFISTMDIHCFLGQKLAIHVTGPESPAPPPPRRGAVTYVVGDDLGWLVPPGGAIAYAIWAYGKTFLVGDTLVFNFVNGTQDVVKVTKAAYETCDTNGTVSDVLTVSPAKVILTDAGEHFFTSTYPRHCTWGQQLAINVTGNASPTASPPSSHAKPPSVSTSGEPSPAPSPTAGGPVAPLSSSAPSHAVVGTFCASVFCVVMYFLL